MIDDPPFDKATEQLTTDERAELIRRYKLPVRVTPPKKLAAARARAAKQRSTAAATNALADRRPLASAAFDVLLRRDAVHRAAGREVLNDLFDEIIDSMPQRYDKTQIRLLLKTYRDEALDKLEASSRNSRQADGDRVGR